MPKVDVCFSPDLISSYDVRGNVAVVIDILRATTSMTAALGNGIKEIYPVSTTEECLSFKDNGYLTAAERNGQKVDGFDFGNSPYSYIDNDVSGQILGMTTTNGTRAINLSKNAEEVIIGSFLNLKKVVTYLLQANKDVLLVCAGWKGRLNLEDTLYAASVIDALKNEFETNSDGCIIALALKKECDQASSRFEYLKECNHVKRLSKQTDILKDIELCLSDEEYDVLPILEGDKLVKYKL